MWKALRQLPMTILHAVSDGMERLIARGFSAFRADDEGDDAAGSVQRRSSRTRLWQLPIRLIYWGFRGMILALAFPIRVWFLPAAQRACFLRGLPALAVAGLTVLGIAVALYRYESTVQRYTSKTIASFSSPDSIQATLYANRIVSGSKNPRRENVYLYGLAHARLQNLDIANAAMAGIAPDGKIGFAPAHQFRAIDLAQQLQRNPGEEILDQLQWHLENAGARDEERNLVMWAQLHQARGNLDKAAQVLEQAGSLHPVHFIAMANIEEKQNDTAASKKALERARDGFLNLLNQKPEDKLSRLQLAVVLSKLKRLEEAEKVLLAGLQLHRDPDMQRATADFYILQFDDDSRELTFLEKLSWLSRAMNIDLHYREIYIRLEKLFDPQLPDEEKGQLKRTLEQILVSGPNPAGAHFALGLLAALTPDTRSNAVWHLAQARTLQPPIAIGYNNFAKILSLADPPRLDEAELLARQAIDGPVQEASFYVTLGQILASQSKWSEAIEVLSTATQKFPDSAPLHQSLASVYEAAGDIAKAATIREIADRIENSKKP
jgi:tetratricopeptide (TPR) repeat protein